MADTDSAAWRRRLGGLFYAEAVAPTAIPVATDKVPA
jgi:hypothetical protein